jgi:hypothetical protein
VNIKGGLVYASSISGLQRNALGGGGSNCDVTVNITGGTVVGDTWVSNYWNTQNLEVTGGTLIVAETLGNALSGDFLGKQTPAGNLTVKNAVLLANVLTKDKSSWWDSLPAIRTQDFAGGTVATGTTDPTAATVDDGGSIQSGVLSTVDPSWATGPNGLEIGQGAITLTGTLDLGGRTLSIPPGWTLNKNGNAVNNGSVVCMPSVKLGDGTTLPAGQITN